MGADKWGGVVTTRGKSSLSAFAVALAEEKVMRDGLMFAAGEPCLESMKSNLERHRRSNPSAVDSLGIVATPTKFGVVKLVVGAIGDNALEGGDVLREPQGDKEDGWKLRFLEQGTIKQAATPWARPALDEIEPGIVPKLTEYLQSKVADLVRLIQ